jgi:hypothetical protein
MKTPTITETEAFVNASKVDKLRLAHEFLVGMSDSELGKLLWSHHSKGWPNKMVRIIARMLDYL